MALDKDGYVAWDSQITVDNSRLPYVIDKVWTLDGKIYAFAGDVARMDAVIQWHQSGAVSGEAPRGDWSLLVVGRRTTQVFTDDAPFASKARAPFAMGSGGPYALGALAAGASAFDAVRIAAKYDTGTGGKINVMHRSDVK
ncbi:MAG: hypothetical protein ACXW13_00140 [Burkholderiaceae bacterium]